MKRFRYRLSTLLWLVAVIAAVLWGIRYRQDRQAVGKLFTFRGGKTIVRDLSPDDMAFSRVEVYRGQKPSQSRGER